MMRWDFRDFDRNNDDDDDDDDKMITIVTLRTKTLNTY